MNKEVYNRICSIYHFDKDFQKLTYDNKILSNEFQESIIYKTLLFEFCFLVNKGSVEFKNMNDIWFFKKFTPEEKNIAIEIIDILLKKIENKNTENSAYINLVGNLLKLNNNRKYNIFKYLQSIYSYYNNQFKYIIFPIIYTLGFDNETLKLYLKNDLKDVVDKYVNEINYEDNIYYYNIDEEFLRNLNKLLYYLNFNEKNPSKKKDINPLYYYLCDYGSISQKPNAWNEKYPENFNYFFEIKDLIKIIESTYKNKNGILFEHGKSEKKKNEENTEANNDLQNKKKNGNSTKSSSDINESNSNINISNGENALNNVLLENNTNNTFTNIHDIVKKEIKIYFEYYEKCNKLKDLCAKISYILDDIKFNKNFLDKYYNILFEIRENKLLISKLSSSILLLQISNLASFRKKLTEVIPFHIIEKYPNYFSLTGDYFPNSSNLNELKAIVTEKQQKSEPKEKEMIDKDLERLISFINIKIPKVKDDCFLYINDKDKIGKKIRMVIDFLKYFKNHFHSIVHMSERDLDYYLLPKSLFSSNLKYADYIFSLSVTIKQNNDDKNEEKNKINFEKKNIDFKLYKDEKIVTIDEALRILFLNNYFNLNEINIDDKMQMKNKFENKLKLFDKNIESFLDIFSIETDGNFILNEEIKTKERDIIEKLKFFDISISKIINDELRREESYNIIKDLKDLIEIEVKEAKKSYLDSENLTIEAKNELINKKTNRLNLILDFLITQRLKINNARKNIYIEYEKYLNILINEAKQYNTYLKRYLSNESEYFDEWTKSVEKIYNKKYLKQDILLENFKDLLQSVKLDVDYSFDEKFFFWCIKNNFSKYLKINN